MIHDILRSAMQITKTFGKILGDEFGEQILRVWVDVGRILDATFEDVFVDFHWRTSIPKWGETAEHFED